MKGFFVISFLFLFYSCANVVTPSGGERDTVPPSMERVIPANQTTEFSSNAIVFVFDEFIQLQNPQTQIIVSPPIEPEPVISARKKVLTIEIPDSLRPNTTYTINFGESIRDLNEGNVLSDFKYVFSTGSYIDSLTLAGEVRSMPSGVGLSDAAVMLYEKLEDSVIYKKKPFYFTKTNASGTFSFSNLKEGDYKIVALKDANNNYLYDQPSEEIGFLDSTIYISDTVQDITLYSFVRIPTLRKTGYKAVNPGRINIFFNRPAYDVEFNSPNKNISHISRNSTNDTISLWISPPLEDSVIIYIIQDTVLDTIRASIPALDTLPLIRNTTISQDSMQPIFQPLIVTFTAPVSIDTSKIMLYENSKKIEIAPRSDSLVTALDINRKWEKDSSYHLVLEKGMATSIYGKRNERVEYHFKATDPGSTGTLRLTIENQTEHSNYILQLILRSRNEESIIENRILNLTNEKRELLFTGIKAGNYNLRFIKDINNNERWDPGDYELKKHPEPVIIYPQAITIKPDWESEIEVILE